MELLIWIGITYILMITALRAGEHFLNKGYNILAKILSVVFTIFMIVFGFLMVLLLGGGLISVFK